MNAGKNETKHLNIDKQMEVLYTALESTVQSSHTFIQLFCSAHAGLTDPNN